MAEVCHRLEARTRHRPLPPATLVVRPWRRFAAVYIPRREAGILAFPAPID